MHKTTCKHCPPSSTQEARTATVTEAHTQGHKESKTEPVCYQQQTAKIAQAAKGRDVPDCELDIENAFRDQIRRRATTEMPDCSCSWVNRQYGMQARGPQTALRASNLWLHQETAALFTLYSRHCKKRQQCVCLASSQAARPLEMQGVGLSSLAARHSCLVKLQALFFSRVSTLSILRRHAWRFRSQLATVLERREDRSGLYGFMSHHAMPADMRTGAA